MKSLEFTTSDELRQRLKKVRSLSGCFRIVEALRKQNLNPQNGSEKIASLTQLLEKMKELSGLDPESMEPRSMRDHHELVFNYTTVLMELVGLWTYSGRSLDEGIELAGRAVRCTQGLGDTKLEASALNYLGNLYQLAQRFPEAKKVITTAAEIDRANNSPLSLTRSMLNLAKVHVAIGNFEEALNIVNEGLQLCKATGSSATFGETLLLGVRYSIYDVLDEPEQALADGLRSLELLKQMGLQDRYVTAHYHLTLTFARLDQPAEAMHHATEAWTHATQSTLPLDAILAKLSLCVAYIHVEEPETAKQYASRALVLARESGVSSMEALCLEQLATIAHGEGDHRRAMELLNEALELHATQIAKRRLLRSIATIWVELEEPEEVRKALKKVEDLNLNLATHRTDSDLQMIMADLATLEGNCEEAIGILKDLSTNENLSPLLRVRANRELSLLFEKKGDSDNALKYYRKYHNLALEHEQRLAAPRLTMFRAQHEVEHHHVVAIRAQEKEKSTVREKEKLALSISERQEMIKRTQDKVNNALHSLERNDIKRLRTELQEILQGLTQTPPTDEKLLHHLPSVDSDFFARLLERYPNLTKGQIRLCGLLRAGLSSSDIAQQLHVSIETVTTQRKRLRKRMNLDSAEKLETILIRI